VVGIGPGSLKKTHEKCLSFIILNNIKMEGIILRKTLLRFVTCAMMTLIEVTIK